MKSRDRLIKSHRAPFKQQPLPAGRATKHRCSSLHRDPSSGTLVARWTQRLSCFVWHQEIVISTLWIGHTRREPRGIVTQDGQGWLHDAFATLADMNVYAKHTKLPAMVIQSDSQPQCTTPKVNWRQFSVKQKIIIGEFYTSIAKDIITS